MLNAVDDCSPRATTPWGRFGIATLMDSPSRYVAAMPLAGLVNPITGAPTLGPLAVLVDFAAGVVNYHRCAPGQWIVSSELSMEFSPHAMTRIGRSPDVPTVASARPFATKGSTSVGLCDIYHDDEVIGIGTVRSFHFEPTGQFPEPPDLRSGGSRPAKLHEIMSLRTDFTQYGAPVLYQQPNSALNNPLGFVHGGVAAAGLELAASAVLNADNRGEPLQTASVRVNYLREFLSGNNSRYEGSISRIGRRSGVGEAQAIGADGSVALIARVTVYR
jgi:uncharacterized protein (TIGR00369 family)